MSLVAVTFNDVVNITPGDDEEYARVLIGLFHQAGDSELARSFLRERRVPATVARRVYDKCADAGIRNEVLTHPGLGEERINKAAYNVLSAVEAGHHITGGDSVEPLCRVFSNQALTRDAIERAIRAADRLPYSVLVPMLRSGALSGGDVRELWRSRAKEPASMLCRSFVEPAVRGGSTPSELVKQWLNDDRYAHVAAQYATCVSEDDVLRVAYDVRLDYGERVRALMNPVLSSEALWREKAKGRVARLYARVADVRADAINKATTMIADTYGTVCIEDLHVAGMVKNHHLARSLSDAALGEFRRQLEYKTARTGAVLRVVDRRFPSSKTCSNCGVVKAKLSLSERVFNCDDCGASMDRDLNAAINIRVAGSAPETLNAHGGTVRRGSPSGHVALVPVKCEPSRRKRAL